MLRNTNILSGLLHKSTISGNLGGKKIHTVPFCLSPLHKPQMKCISVVCEKYLEKQSEEMLPREWSHKRRHSPQLHNEWHKKFRREIS